MPTATSLDFLEKLTQSILRTDVEVYLGGFEAIVSEDLLQAGGTHTLFHTINGEAMAKYMRCYRLGNQGFVSDSFDDTLRRAFAEAYAVVSAEMKFKEFFRPSRKRHDPSFAPVTILSTFAPDDQAILLPVDLFSSQIADFAYPKARIQQHPDNQLFPKRVASVRDFVTLFGVQRLTHENVGHVKYLSSIVIKMTVLSLSSGEFTKSKRYKAYVMSVIGVEGDILTQFVLCQRLEIEHPIQCARNRDFLAKIKGEQKTVLLPVVRSLGEKTSGIKST